MALTRLELPVIIVLLTMADCCLAEEAAMSSPLPAIPMCGLINASQQVQWNTTIEPNQASASFIMGRSNIECTLDMFLTSPSGKRIDPSAEPPVVFASNGSVTYYIVPNPEPGVWGIIIKANDTNKCSQGYCIALDKTEQLNENAASGIADEGRSG